eukprot:TRINITY_DN5549_c0_g1_i1.p1 TRINITY_DN5549_c0_g1~~TRINITY_DN5549_c0_g1_i1.p1  ORF type:complete len:395 (-),score=75.13 TRINITY_DN5549_c0_g1_i1:15-1103(-)
MYLQRFRSLRNLPEGLESIAELLTALDLEGNNMQHIPPHLIEFSALQYLNLRCNNLHGVLFGNMDAHAVAPLQLVQLQAHRNALCCITHAHRTLARFEHLKSLQLGSNQLLFLPCSLRLCAALERVDVAANPLLLPNDLLSPPSCDSMQSIEPQQQPHQQQHQGEQPQQQPPQQLPEGEEHEQQRPFDSSPASLHGVRLNTQSARLFNHLTKLVQRHTSSAAPWHVPCLGGRQQSGTQVVPVCVDIPPLASLALAALARAHGPPLDGEPTAALISGLGVPAGAAESIARRAMLCDLCESVCLLTRHVPPVLAVLFFAGRRVKVQSLGPRQAVPLLARLCSPQCLAHVVHEPEQLAPHYWVLL